MEVVLQDYPSRHGVQIRVGSVTLRFPGGTGATGRRSGSISVVQQSPMVITRFRKESPTETSPGPRDNAGDWI